MALEVEALTSQQTNAWPVDTKGFSVSGERLPKSATKEQTDVQFLQLARERFKLCDDAEGKRREQMLMDLQFRCGIQWDLGIKQNRTTKGRPCHTINRVPEFVGHVVNNMRQARPAIKVDPVGDKSDQEAAEIRQGLIRYIERISQADVAYDTGFENMCVMGLGWMRIVDDWSAPDSFDKDLFIRWISNTFSVYSDPTCSQPDWSDMKFAFVVDDIMPDEFKARWGEEKACSSLQFQTLGDEAKYWFPQGKVRVAEYFHIEQEDDVLCELSPGTTRLLSELPQGMYKSVKDRLIMVSKEDGTETDVGRTRKCTTPAVYWSLITGLDKLEERKWKGKFIPLIPIIGNQVDLDGDRLVMGMVRFAREIQQMYNYIYSCLTEVVALAPRNQFIMAVDQIPDGDGRTMWERSNTDPQAVLFYKHFVDAQGNPAPPPQRSSAIIEISGLVEALQVIDNMLKAVFGIYDASLGQRGPQESGKAINARKIESDTSTYNWGDNFIRAQRNLGTMVDDLLEFYYNTPGRIVQILRDDQSQDAIVMNQTFKDKKTGEDQKYDLSQGKFAVVISTEPSFATKRQESAKSMEATAQVYPKLWDIAGDIMVKEMDWPGKDAIANRLEKALPPGLQDADPDAPPIPPEFQQKLAQLQDMVQKLSQALHVASDKTEQERTKQEWETYRQEQTDATNRFIAMLKVGSDEAKTLNQELFVELRRIQAKIDPELDPNAVQPGQPSSAATPTGSDNSSGGGQ